MSFSTSQYLFRFLCFMCSYFCPLSGFFIHAVVVVFFSISLSVIFILAQQILAPHSFCFGILFSFLIISSYIVSFFQLFFFVSLFVKYFHVSISIIEFLLFFIRYFFKYSFICHIICRDHHHLLFFVLVLLLIGYIYFFPCFSMNFCNRVSSLFILISLSY